MKSDQLCAIGKVIRPQRDQERMRWDEVGPCDGCGTGPLHGATSNQCSCSARREHMRLCRRCAVAYDLDTKGWSPLLDHAENAAIRLANVLSEMPNLVPERESEHQFRFVVTINAYGRRSVVNRSVSKSLMRALHLAFGEGVHVRDSRDKRIIYSHDAHERGDEVNVLHTEPTTNGNGNHA